MPYYCSECENFYREKSIVPTEYRCPDIDCPRGSITKVSANMISIIKCLNNKNYPVKCVDFESDSIYILLKKERHFKNLPTGFSVEYLCGDYDCDYTETFIKYSDDSQKTLKEMDNIFKNLTEWTAGLRMCKLF